MPCCGDNSTSREPCCTFIFAALANYKIAVQEQTLLFFATTPTPGQLLVYNDFIEQLTVDVETALNEGLTNNCKPGCCEGYAAGVVQFASSSIETYITLYPIDPEPTATEQAIALFTTNLAVLSGYVICKVPPCPEPNVCYVFTRKCKPKDECCPVKCDPCNFNKKDISISSCRRNKLDPCVEPKCCKSTTEKPGNCCDSTSSTTTCVKKCDTPQWSKWD